MPAERLQKVLARAGFGSRRSAEGVIVSGRVTVNGEVASLGSRADPAVDRIEVDGGPIEMPGADVTLLLHKPAGVVVTADDEHGRQTVYDLLADAPKHLRYVGRLDQDTSGLLLLTTDGELAHRLTHPRWEAPKTYEATLDRPASDEAIARLAGGVQLEDGMTAPAEVSRVSADPPVVRLVIHEGRNRQVRRMFEAVGYRVTRLVRTMLGPVAVGDLPPGASRLLTEPELEQLRTLVGIPPAS